MSIIVSFVTIILIFILISFIRQIKRRQKHPPGPLGWPFFGEKPLLLMKLFFPKWFVQRTTKEYFATMKKKYGDIWSVDLGNKKVVVMTCFDMMIKSLVDNGKLFAGRPYTKYYGLISERRGMSFIDGEESARSRSLSMKALRNLGMGSNRIEEEICQEVDNLMENIEKNSSGKFCSPQIFDKPIANIISQLLFNKRFQYDDKDLNDFINNLKIIFHAAKEDQIIEMFSEIIPMKYLKKLFPSVEVFIEGLNRGLDFVNRQCLMRKTIQNEFAKPSCVFDFFWRYRFQDYPEIPLEDKLLDIKHTMFDMYFAGADSVTIMLSFCCLILGKKQDVQQDLRKEIELLTDYHKNITMEMRKDCPKMLSFIDEVQRICNLVPQLIRRAMKTCMFDKYEINPLDIVYVDLDSIFTNPQVFEKPYEFDAYRFLDATRTKYIPSRHLLPFGIGKRSCIGESLAVMEIFLFITRIILKFNIFLPDEVENKFEKILQGPVGLLQSPKEHEIIFQRRFI